MTRIAIIADDLTGALDTASPFACRGARAICLTEPGSISKLVHTEAQVLSVSTNSRHMAPEQAAEVVRSTAEEIRDWKPDIVLKKIDSRLKGNVAQESAAVASVFGFKRLLLVPAAPDIGRYVRDGAVAGFGVEKPVPIAERFSESELASDVPDITSREAMFDVARDYLERRDRLSVCSRGFAVALAEHIYPGPLRPAPAVEEPVLIAIGSRDEVTVRQRKALCEAGRFVCLEAPEGKVPDKVPAVSHLLLFCAGTMQPQAEGVARTFAGGVCRVAAALKPRSLLCSGGDTALAFLRSAGQTVLEILGEVAPGLPISVVNIAGRHVGFISKSGGFGGASTLLDLFKEKPVKAGLRLAHT
jgi:D-threonate/D-erythronate kinase